MPSLPRRLDPLDRRITAWMARHGVLFARLALGIVYLWFGALKFFPAASPAAGIAARTIERVSFGLAGPSLALPLLATWETAIGVGLLTGRFLRATLLLLFVQVLGTALPLVLFRAETFASFPLSPTLEGQYIVKNLVLGASAIVVGATVRGGRLTASPGRERSG